MLRNLSVLLSVCCVVGSLGMVRNMFISVVNMIRVMILGLVRF